MTELSDELREIVLDILRRPPISDILFRSTYTPSMTEAIPITSLQLAAMVAVQDLIRISRKGLPLNLWLGAPRENVLQSHAML